MRKSLYKLITVLFLVLCFASVAAAGPTIDSILKKKELVVGTSANLPPLTFKAKDGTIKGFDMDVSRMIAAAMDVKLRVEVMPFNDLIPALESGKIDMILSCMTITPDRNLRVLYVGPYFVSGQSILTTKDVAININSVDDINKSDFSISVPKGTTTEKIAKLMLPKAKLVIAGSTDEAFDMLRKKKVKAMMADYPYTSVTSFKYQDKGFVANPPFSVEPIGIAIRPDDPLLTNFLENFLFLVKGDGMLDAASKRWFADPSWISELP